MPSQETDINPVSHITIDAIGKPGQRVFYIQAFQGETPTTFIVEKVQVQTLVIGIMQFLEEIRSQHPDLAEADGDYDEDRMRITPPVDPLFRAGELGLAYDENQDLMVLAVREILLSGMEEDDASEVRLWCRREQLLAMARWANEVAEHGRPICPQCGEPMEPEGHFCPKKNGHKH
jgi:uncharacterized repeat protein (TIGR03847 family)